MKILLVDPYYLNGNSPPNWSLGVIEAAMLDHKWEVKVLDFCLPGETFDSLAAFRRRETAFTEEVARVAASCTDLFITTSFGVPQKPTPILNRIGKILKAVKDATPDCRVHVGGAQIDYLQRHERNPRELLPPSLVDCFHSEPERSLIPTLESGIARNATLTAFGSTPPLSLPTPLWKGWDLEKYPPYRAAITSLGCRYKCSFCFEALASFEAFTFPDILTAFSNQGMSRLAVEDSTIFGAHGLAKIAESCEALPKNLVFTAYALVNEVIRVAPSVLADLRAVGLISVILGIESPDEVTLRKYRKSVQAIRVREAIAKLQAADIQVQGCLMVGIPEVSLGSTLATLEYGLDLEIDVRRWHVFQPGFTALNPKIETPIPLSLDRFSQLDVNIPAALLPELMATEGCPELFLEEHALVRSLPYVDAPIAGLKEIRYEAGYRLDELFARMIDVLKPTKGSFDEEDYYRVLCPDSKFHEAVYDGAKAQPNVPVEENV